MKKRIFRKSSGLFLVSILSILLISFAIYGGHKYNKINMDALVKSTVSIVGGIDIDDSMIVDDVSVGTGFFFDKGLILTANHNITTKCFTITYDGNLFETKVLYTDATNDIAILEINANHYPYLELTDAKVKIGEDVSCVCTPKTPFLKNTVLTGKVTNTTINGLANQYLLQTDLPLSPGCSGSPVINKSGEVIAMNAFKSTEFATEGLSYAVFGSKLINTIEKFRNETLPIDLKLTLSENLNNQYGLLLESGIIVNEVDETSILYGKIMENDVIKQVDGKEIFTKADFYENFEIGSMILIIRNGETIGITISAEELQS